MGVPLATSAYGQKVVPPTSTTSLLTFRAAWSEGLRYCFDRALTRSIIFKSSYEASQGTLVRSAVVTEVSIRQCPCPVEFSQTCLGLPI
jgi:hypothetical protein